MTRPSRHIILIILLLTAVGCRKEKLINTYNPHLTLTQKYTHMMGGARNWAVTVAEYSNGSQNDTAYALDDISFKIEIINDTTIKVFSDTLRYVVDDTVNSLYYVKSTLYDFCSIRYFYQRDSLEFYKMRSTPDESVIYTYNTYSVYKEVK